MQDTFTLGQVIHYAVATKSDYLSTLRALRTDPIAIAKFNEWRGLSAGGAQ